MQPYQKASKQILDNNDVPGKIIKNVASTAAAITGGGAILNRITPFLNKFIPAATAVQGLSKVEPRIGRFINGAVNQGNTMDETLSFIKDKTEPEIKTAVQGKQNIIEQVSPELHEFLKDLIGQGIMPKVAADKATKSGKFSKIIEALKKHTKQDIGAIVESIFGNQQKEVSLNDILGQLPQVSAQQPQQPQQAQPQGNQPNQALMQALQAAQQSRQRRQKP